MWHNRLDGGPAKAAEFPQPPERHGSFAPHFGDIFLLERKLNIFKKGAIRMEGME
jgi:hypothetical protein